MHRPKTKYYDILQNRKKTIFSRFFSSNIKKKCSLPKRYADLKDDMKSSWQAIQLPIKHESHYLKIHIRALSARDNSFSGYEISDLAETWTRLHAQQIYPDIPSFHRIVERFGLFCSETADHAYQDITIKIKQEQNIDVAIARFIVAIDSINRLYCF